MAMPKSLRAVFSAVLAAGLVLTALPATSQMRVDGETASTVRAGKYALPLAPETYRMTSPMGPRCMPVVGGSTHHLGQDMGAKDNAPIYAVAAGTVRAIVKGTNSTSGQVVITHRIDGSTYESAYMHMWPNDVLVKKNQEVAAGQKIALVGSSGPSTGPHLHLEIWKDRFYSADGNVRNPASFLKSRGLDLDSYATAGYSERQNTCTYYARGKADLFASASDTSRILARPGRNTKVSSEPGAINGLRNGSFIKVKVGSASGWMNRFAVTPNRLAAASEGSVGPAGTVTNGVRVPFAIYQNTDGMNMRAGAATWYSRLLTIPAGASFEAYESSAGWLRVKYKGTEGWVSAALVRRTAIIDQSKLAATHEVLRDLRLRSGAGGTYEETQALKRGAQVAVRQVRGAWSQIQAGKQTGWILSTDMKRIGSATPQAAKPPVAKPSPTKPTHETTTNLNLRSGAGTNTKIVAVLRSGTDVIELQRQGTWSRVKAGKTTGWVSNAYLRTIKAVATPPRPPAKPQAPARPKPPAVQWVKKATYTTKVKVVARKSADARSAAMVGIPAKKNVSVDAKSGSWLRVKYAGKTGWVPARQLAAYKAPARTKTTTDRLNLRTGTSTSARSLLVIPKGKKIPVKATRGGWTQTSYAGKSGWVSSRYLR